MGKTIVALDSTKLNVLQLCPRKFNWVFNESQTPVEKASHLERGDLIHQMLKEYYILRKARSRWAQHHHTHEDIIKICKKVGEHHAVTQQLNVEEVDETMFQFTEYCRYYEYDGWDTIVAVEQVGSKIIYEDDDICIVYEIKPDLILQLQGGMILPVDHKTAKQRKEPSGLSNQFMSYPYMLTCNNIVINKIGFQKTLPPKDRFQRYTISFPDDVLIEWKDNAVWWIKQLLMFYHEGYWPANYTSCDKWAGCSFAPVCIKEPIAREFKLKQLFEIATPWDIGRGL